MAMGRIGRYDILERIGQGEMGGVYKALHPQFKKYIAIKEIQSPLANNPQVQGRFQQTVELLSQLPPHLNIVAVRDAVISKGCFYIVMDYVEGEPLSDLIKNKGVDPERGAGLLDQILSGLESIHRRGILH